MRTLTKQTLQIITDLKEDESARIMTESKLIRDLIFAKHQDKYKEQVIKLYKRDTLVSFAKSVFCHVHDDYKKIDDSTEKEIVDILVDCIDDGTNK